MAVLQGWAAAGGTPQSACRKIMLGATASVRRRAAPFWEGRTLQHARASIWHGLAGPIRNTKGDKLMDQDLAQKAIPW